jgi:hypothetical protein
MAKKKTETSSAKESSPAPKPKKKPVAKVKGILDSFKEGNFDTPDNRITEAVTMLSGVVAGSKQSYSNGEAVWVLTEAGYNDAVSAVESLKSINS